MIRAWQQRAAQLQPRFTQTDLLGAMFIASQSFEQASAAARKLLIVFSDMRQSTRSLDFEQRTAIQADVALQQVMRAKLLPDLDRKSTRLNSSHLGISYAV